MLKKDLEKLVEELKEQNEDLEQQLNDLDMCYGEMERAAANNLQKLSLSQARSLICAYENFLDNKELLTDPLRDAFREYINYELERWVEKYEK